MSIFICEMRHPLLVFLILQNIVKFFFLLVLIFDALYTEINQIVSKSFKYVALSRWYIQSLGILPERKNLHSWPSRALMTDISVGVSRALYPEHKLNALFY